MTDQVTISKAAFERLKAVAAAISDTTAAVHTVLGGVIDHLREVLAGQAGATLPEDVTAAVSTALDQLDASKSDLAALAASGQAVDTAPAGGDSTTSATAGDDTLSGASGNDTLLGGQGDDTLASGAGNDTIDAGAGNDTVTTGAGNDTLDAGAAAAAGVDASVSGASIPDGSVIQQPSE